MKNKERLDEGELEEIVVVLSPLNYRLSKIPVAGKMYLKIYKTLLKNKLPDYQNLIFK